MTEHTGVVKSADWHKGSLHVKFEVPNTDQMKTTKLDEQEARNLLAYLKCRLPQDIIGKEAPLFKDVFGRWFIDTPDAYKRGNKLKYKLKRVCMENNLYVWSDEYKKRGNYRRPVYEDTPAVKVSGSDSYYASFKFRMIVFVTSVICFISSLLQLFGYFSPNKMLVSIAFLTAFSSFIIAGILMPTIITGSLRAIFPQKG
jgi:hypothetical protein